MINGMNIGTVAIQQMLVSQLQQQEQTLGQLSEQLASQKKYTDLTDYTPSEALDLINLQNGANARQGYLSVIQTVQTRLTGYDNTMTDMESVVSQALSLAQGNPSYDASTSSNITAMAQGFLKSISVDLNQQIGGRYIYAGSRYTTEPVTDLTTLGGAPSATIYTDGETLPNYDTDYAASSLTMSAAGNAVTVGGTVAPPQNATVTVTVGGQQKTYSYDVQSTDTPTTIAAGLAALVAADVPGTTSSGAVLTVGGTGTVDSAASNVTSTTAYAADQATIDSGYTVTYGVSADNPAFQQIIAGLRFLNAAGGDTDAASYKSDITQAQTLLSSGLTALQAVHTGVAYNINTLTSETDTQNNAINNISDQIANIQQVDMTQVTAEVNLLQTQLQASYSATGIIGRLSIVQYL